MQSHDAVTLLTLLAVYGEFALKDMRSTQVEKRDGVAYA